VTPERVCAVSDLPDGEAKGFTLSRDGRQTRIVVVRQGDVLRAYLNRCPHEGTPLDWTPGRFLSPRKEYLVCQIHGALFEIEDGFCVDGPCAGDSLVPLEISVHEDEIFVLTGDGDA